MEQQKRIRLAGLTIAQYDAILNHCNSNIFVTDGEGRVLYANGAAERALNCTFDRLRQMDIYQLRADGYTTHSSSADAIKTKRKSFAVYKNNLGEEIATTSTPVLDGEGNIELVVTRSDEVGSILAQQKELDRYRTLYQQMLTRSDSPTVTLIAEDPHMKEIVQTLKKYAQSDVTILLTGESGTGKEVLAGLIRQHSLRRDMPFLSINCAAVPNDLIESELFGYEKGAFTGASREGKPGLFELANGGTIFLDEVGELSLMAQSKLLRVLESGEFMRVGGQKVQKTNVRIVAATNRDLKTMISQKEFRADLYYRLCVLPVSIPPLRERPLDIDTLARHFLEMFNRKHRQERPLPPELLSGLRAYSWPGNIRELRNTMENYVITGEPPRLAEEAKPVPAAALPRAAALSAEPAGSLREVVERAEKAQIQAVLKLCGGDVSRAAERLGIHRSVLYKKISKYQLRHRPTYDFE